MGLGDSSAMAGCYLTTAIVGWLLPATIVVGVTLNFTILQFFYEGHNYIFIIYFEENLTKISNLK
jgi:hypothetical protein